MNCPKCHTILPEDSAFCSKYGTKLDISGKAPQPKEKIPSAGLKDQISFTKTLETTPDEPTRGTVFAGRFELIE